MHSRSHHVLRREAGARGYRSRHANIDPKLIERAITPRTKAILPVHLYGRPADMDPIREIAAKHNLKIFEDAAQALEARYRSQRVGAIGNCAAFSFYPSKNFGAYGEGGALTTNDDAIAKYARAARSHGQTARYDHEFVGFNYRMQGFQGAVLRIKLRRLHAWTVAAAPRYIESFAEVKLIMPKDDPRDSSVYHQFAIYVGNRNALIAKLAERGIDTAVHYPRPINLQPAYSPSAIPPALSPTPSAPARPW